MNNIEAGGNEHYQRSAAGLEDTEIPDLVARALSLGWSVIPCRADKRPCLAWKQFQSRTPTPKEIQSWHSRYNPSAWAVITGAVSGVVVLDFDGEAGDRTRTDLKLTPHVKTGSGGSHVYVDHPGWGTKTVNGRGKTILGEQFPGLDIRGDGGYAVFFGQNESGTYQWVREMRPDPLETLPNNVRNLLGLLHPPETLLAKRHDGIPNDLARLKGARFVAAVETEEGKQLAESRIKQMAGGDTISARFMRGEWFDFRPEFKVFLATNHKPQIKGTDHAIWRRIRLVPFTVRIPPDKQDKHLGEKLLEELPGVLNFAVQGCLDWQRDGLRPPDEVTRATAEYRNENDQVGRFIAECCITGEHCQCKARPLYQEYRRWATEVGEDLLTETAFARRLAERGFDKKRTTAGNSYLGIGLVPRERDQSM